jgi:hypothetical protein
MNSYPLSFIGEPIKVLFDQPPLMVKAPTCPDGFIWRGETFRVEEMLETWVDFSRRGRFARNMRESHAVMASKRGSWGVGRFHFRVRVVGGRIFHLYYDRAPGSIEDRLGHWFLLGERRTA